MEVRHFIRTRWRVDKNHTICKSLPKSPCHDYLCRKATGLACKNKEIYSFISLISLLIEMVLGSPNGQNKFASLQWVSFNTEVFVLSFHMNKLMVYFCNPVEFLGMLKRCS